MIYHDKDYPVKKLLSPEELEEQLEKLEQPYVMLEERHIPTYKVIKNYFVLFIICLVSIATLVMNGDKFGYHYYSMLSGSMADEIPKGSLVVAKEISPKQLKKGDIITFINTDQISVTHEIISIVPSNGNAKSTSFETKGSTNEVSDSELVKEEQIVGKVIFHIPMLGKLLMYGRQ